MTILNCQNCGGTHYGSLECPFKKAPCVICGSDTILACSDCAINSGGKTSVHVCEKAECRDAHEQADHPMTEPKMELMPCPFCGAIPIAFPSGMRDEGLMIQCMTDGCLGPHCSYIPPTEAIAAWNRRPAPPAATDWRDRFWQIVDGRGLLGLPSDEWNALSRLVERYAATQPDAAKIAAVERAAEAWAKSTELVGVAQTTDEAIEARMTAARAASALRAALAAMQEK